MIRRTFKSSVKDKTRIQQQRVVDFFQFIYVEIYIMYVNIEFASSRIWINAIQYAKCVVVIHRGFLNQLISSVLHHRLFVNFLPPPPLHPNPTTLSASFASAKKQFQRDTKGAKGERGPPRWLLLIAGRRKTSVMSRLVSPRLVFVPSHHTSTPTRLSQRVR